MKIRDFHYFLFAANKNPKYGCKIIVQTMVQICAQFLISRLKIGGAIAISLVAMATAALILFLDVVFELIEKRIWFIYFSGSLVDCSCSLCLFFREIKKKAFSTGRKRWRHCVDDVI